MSYQLVAEAATYTTNTSYEHPRHQRNSNPRSQRWSCRRPTSLTARTTVSAHCHI